MKERIKYIGINLTKEGKDLHTENYKTLLTSVKEDTKNGKIHCAHRLKRLILLKCLYHLKKL